MKLRTHDEVIKVQSDMHASNLTRIPRIVCVRSAAMQPRRFSIAVNAA